MKKILIIAVIFTISAVSIGLYLYFKPEKDLEKAIPDIVITAKEFIEDYSSDETSGNTKYVGKIVEVSGILSSVESNESGIGTVFIEDDFFGISCVMDSAYFASKKIILDTLTEGGSLIIKGRCNGILTNIQMSDCILVEKSN